MITRSADHRYTYEGVTYPGVTSILNVLDKSGPLMAWAARQTAEAAIEQLPNLPSMLASSGPEGVTKFLTARSTWKRDEAAALGTEVHDYADRMIRGETLPAMSDTARKRVDNYREWWEASGWTLRLSEAMVVHPDPDPPHALGWGGTFDLLVRDREGCTVLADIKTGGKWGRKVYVTERLQLAAYGMASRVQPPSRTLGLGEKQSLVYPMPMPDRYSILHVTAEGVNEFDVHIGQPERMAFLACLELYHWLDSVKGKR